MTMPTEAKNTESAKVIEVENLVTHYGDRMILKGVTMDVRENEIMVIMGGSGSGKSTLLRHLMALEAHTSGVMKILGRDISGLSAIKKKTWRGLPGRRAIQLHDR